MRWTARLWQHRNTAENPEHKRAKKLVLTENEKKIYALLIQKQIPSVNLIANKFKTDDLELTSFILKKLINEFDP